MTHRPSHSYHISRLYLHNLHHLFHQRHFCRAFRIDSHWQRIRLHLQGVGDLGRRGYFQRQIACTHCYSKSRLTQ